MTNKKIGNEYERKFAEMMSKQGYWVHIFGDKQNGQPCDIIAIKDNIAFLLDVKHCCGERFNISRVEANQQSTFDYAVKYCGVTNVGFAIYFDKIETWKFLPYHRITNQKSFHYKEL